MNRLRLIVLGCLSVGTLMPQHPFAFSQNGVSTITGTAGGQSQAALANASTSDTELAATPPMGWGSWNHFFCDYTDETIRAQADALVSSGMRELGYKYVEIQECIAPARDKQGNLIVDSKRFPHGMKPLVDYIHSRGLKAGIYTDVGPYTCYEDENEHYAGSFEHEDQDAATFASWGIDFIFEDYCNKPEARTGRELYERMASAIQKTGRPMILYICSWGNENPWIWGHEVGQVWRTDSDLSVAPDKGEWDRVVRNFESNGRHAIFSAPGGWNDPDMLEVGNRGLTDKEARSHFSMWAISAAPLVAGNDLTNMSETTRAILSNRDAIAIDQDPLGAQGVKIRGSSTGEEVWAKPLESRTGGSYAVLLVNFSSVPKKVAVQWAELGLEGSATVYDVWTHQNHVGVSQGYAVDLAPHESALLRVSGKFDWDKGASYPAVWPGNTLGSDAAISVCADCAYGYAVRLPGQTHSEMRFSGIVVDAEGTYSLSIAYMYPPSYDSDNSGDESKVEMLIDDTEPVIYPLPGYRYGTITVERRLHKGRNSVLLRVETTKGAIYIESLGIARH